MDTWDRTREVAEVTWQCLPTPLPGFATASKAQQLLAWGLSLTACPRVDDADAGEHTALQSSRPQFKLSQGY